MMIELLLLAALQAAPSAATATAAAEPANVQQPATAEEPAEPAVQKPRKVCRTVADTRVSPLASRRKVCREVFDQDHG